MDKVVIPFFEENVNIKLNSLMRGVFCIACAQVMNAEDANNSRVIRDVENDEQAGIEDTKTMLNGIDSGIDKVSAILGFSGTQIRLICCRIDLHMAMRVF